jgi:hypothetical protein
MMECASTVCGATHQEAFQLVGGLGANGGVEKVLDAVVRSAKEQQQHGVNEFCWHGWYAAGVQS